MCKHATICQQVYYVNFEGDRSVVLLKLCSTALTDLFDLFIAALIGAQHFHKT